MVASIFYFNIVIKKKIKCKKGVKELSRLTLLYRGGGECDGKWDIATKHEFLIVSCFEKNKIHLLLSVCFVCECGDTSVCSLNHVAVA